MADVDDEDAFAALHAPRLRALYLHAHVTMATLRGLAANRAVCDRLETLYIRPSYAGTARRVPFDNAIAEEVFEKLTLPRLRRLTLEHCWFASETRVAALRERAPLLEDVEIGA
jgi:hypothetical protein